MVIKLEKVQSVGEDLVKLLRLKTYPVGIKLFKSEDEVPKEFEKVEEKFAVCHFIGMARFHEKALYALSKNSESCIVGATAMGFIEPPDDFAQKGVGVFAGTVEAVEKIIKRLNPLPLGKYKAFGVSPLNKIPVNPDVVQIFGDPLQLLVLVYSNTWNGEPDIYLGTNGHGSSCYEAMVIPFQKKKITMSIADMGDRRYGYASDDEIIMGVPIEKLELLYEGLLKTMKTKNRYPVLYNFHSIDAKKIRE